MKCIKCDTKVIGKNDFINEKQGFLCKFSDMNQNEQGRHKKHHKLLGVIAFLSIFCVSSPECMLKRSPSSPNLLTTPVADDHADSIIIDGSTDIKWAGLYKKEKSTFPAGEGSTAETPVTKAMMLHDSNLLSIPVHRLATAFGIQKHDGMKVVDISYPYLRRYAQTLNDFWPKVQAIDGITISSPGGKQTEAIDSLYSIARDSVLEVGKEDETEFKEIFSLMVANKTGEQRIKALIILQKLINCQKIGASYYRDKKIKVVLKSAKSQYECVSHTVYIGNECGIITLGGGGGRRGRSEVSGGCFYA
jgi:hypothetical protein